MLLGIVVHAALPYTSGMGIFWPPDESASHVVTTIFHFIHIWRMPLFFILVGFFANLAISRKSWKNWWGNRLLRIGLPIIVFYPLMGLTLPWIFTYGKIGEVIFFYSDEGQPFHLWFLVHLIIFVVFTAIFRGLYLGAVAVLGYFNKIRMGFIGRTAHQSRSVSAGILLRSRFPIVFIIVWCVANIFTAGELIINPIGSLLYFALGYSLYGNTSLFTFLKAHWMHYFVAGLVGFSLFMIVTLVLGSNLGTDIYNEGSTRERTLVESKLLIHQRPAQLL